MEDKLRRFSMILEDDEDGEFEELEVASDEDHEGEFGGNRALLSASPMHGVSGGSSHASDGGESDGSLSSTSRPSSAASGSVAGAASGSGSTSGKKSRRYRHRHTLMVTRSSPQLLKNILEEEADALSPLKHEQVRKRNFQTEIECAGLGSV